MAEHEIAVVKLSLLQIIVPRWNGFGHGRVVLLVVFAGTFFSLLLLTGGAGAACQPGEITVGDGKGGSTTYPAQKQTFKESGYSNIMPFGLAQLDNGQIIPASSLEAEKLGKANKTITSIRPVVSFSSDVAALRTDPPAQIVVSGLSNDILCGTDISISKDNGLSWSPLNRLFDAGRHHADLRLLANGDIVMTMIVRDDMQFGGGLLNDQRGEDALISHDNGLTWNLDRRITLDTFSNHDPVAPQAPDALCGHIATTVLKDGSVLRAYGNYLDSSAVMTKWNPAVIQSK